MVDLSVLIPARNEEWLKATVEDVCRNKRGNTNVIVVLDGQWPMQGLTLQQHPDVDVLYHAQPIGQRAATNLAAKVSNARYVMKLDAHAGVSEGFDVELIAAAEQLGPDVTQIPAQWNLHVFDWVCEPCSFRADQSPALKSCPQCGGALKKDVVWKKRTRSEFWRFDSEPKFQYWGAYKDRPESQGDICDVMTSLGACFFMARDRFFELGGLDEAGGIWGNFGIEIACKSWLSGGRHVVNKRVWFSHFFRVGGHGFPYQLSGSQQQAARDYSRNMWFNNAWPGQKLPLRWLVDKFWPIPGWSEEQRDALPTDLPASSVASASRSSCRGADVLRVPAGADRGHAQVGPESVRCGVVYYSDNKLDPFVFEACREQLHRAVENRGPFPVVSVTLKPFECDFGSNIVLPLERSYLSMFRQILAGLEALDTRFIFLAEHDVLYAREHFDFVPPRDDVYYYNLSWFKVDAETGRALTYRAKQVSQLCANRELLIAHYRKRIAIVERDGFSRKQGFEPGSHGRKERIDDVRSDVWRSAVPNIDIRHGANLTPSRWRRDQFRDQSNCEEWQEADGVPGWGRTLGRFREFLSALQVERVA